MPAPAVDGKKEDRTAAEAGHSSPWRPIPDESGPPPAASAASGGIIRTLEKRPVRPILFQDPEHDQRGGWTGARAVRRSWTRVQAPASVPRPPISPGALLR